MKRFFMLVTLVFSFATAFSNAAPTSSAFVSELYFDDNGDWTIELYFTYYDAETDTGYVMITPTDTAFFNKFPDSTNIVLLTSADLSKPIALDKTGDMFWFENWFDDMTWPLAASFVFGDYPGSKVNAPYAGQSLVGIYGKVVKDTSSSLGYRRDPAKGILIGHIYDSVGIPLPYIRVQTYGIEAKILWPDENGFFTDTLYAKNYAIFIYNGNPHKIYGGGFTIEPDSTTIHDIYLPVSAEMEISGYCFLADTDDYSNTKVYLKPQCPFAPTDTIITDSAGHYSKVINVGHYALRFSHENYLPDYTYNPVDMFFDTVMNDVYLQKGIVHEIAEGMISGRWVADYPYWIFGDLTIQEADSLIIDPGVQVVFKRNKQWNVFGTLLAGGTEDDTIRIFSISPGRWGPLNFLNETSSNSKLKYTDMSLQESIKFFNASPSIEKSLITWNTELDFYGSSAPVINECYFDFGVKMFCYDSSAPVITRNFLNESVTCHDQSTPRVFNNDFFSFWVAIECFENGNPEINSNIFQKGGYAMDFRFGQAPSTVKHNVFFDLYDPVWGNSQWIPGFGILDTTNANGDTCDVYFNLFMDPLLTAPDNGDFSLITGSPCIDAGDPDFPFDPDSTIADIGALYFDQTGVFIQNRKTNKPDVKLYHYPNPANDFVSFVVESNEWYMLKNASIKIYSLSGIKIGEVPCPLIDKGFGKKIYRYDLNNNIIKPGTYFYTFEANGKVLSSNKMIVLR